MTKREYEKYNKIVYDKYGNRLYPGDTVVIADDYFNDCNTAIVKHFASKTVILDAYDLKYKWYKAQRYPYRIIKIKDKDDIFVQNWPERKPETT